MLKKLNKFGKIDYIKVWMWDMGKKAIIAFYLYQSKTFNLLKKKEQEERERPKDSMEMVTV